jgi:hypothetical protein
MKPLFFIGLGLVFALALFLPGESVTELMVKAVLGFLVYFIPGIVSVPNKHPQSNGITVLNLFLGWTVLGWIGALIWACCKSRPVSIADK